MTLAESLLMEDLVKRYPEPLQPVNRIAKIKQNDLEDMPAKLTGKLITN
jgi:hypothetical protein